MNRAGEVVLLFHGLWMNRAAMIYLVRSLAASGFRARSVGYLSAMRDFDDNAARVRRAIANADGSAVHLVAHSLGGMICLRALEHMPKHRVQRVVLLGTPIGGCVGGRQLAESRWGAPLLGKTKSLWLATPKLHIPDNVEVGAIAGTRRFGLGGILLKLPLPNDGVVTVAETRHPHLVDHLVLPIAHSQMLVSPRVSREIATFLKTGRFAR